MAIDLLDVIRDDSAVRSGGFTGAVFLTYSLNLTFFEQIVAPALDQAGCSNVLILADPDGYQQALEMGANSIQTAGLRYVCAPVFRRGYGIQHAKMLFMVGPNRGRLLVGSGNLTFHGFGRNLEIFSKFNYDVADGSSESIPFLEAWSLIERIASENKLSTAAQQQIKTISEIVPWLRTSASDAESNVWHNYDHSLFEQLAVWRQLHGFLEPIQKLSAISPYYDQHLSAIKRLTDEMSPTQLRIHLDPGLTNLDGKQAAQEWRRKSPKLNAFAIGPAADQNSQRHVHAKAIIGQEKNGSWCMTGSANLSQSALLSSWQTGGNLELVTFYWSEDPKAFDYLVNNEMIQTWQLDLSKITVTEAEPSERENTHQADLFLTDLSLQSEKIEGKLSSPLPAGIGSVKLHLQRKNLDMPVKFQDETKFVTLYKISLEDAEYARLEGEGLFTPYRWIDQPAALARYGARTYQARIKGKLETLLGAEKLFQELMNFLWERVDFDHKNEDDLNSHLHRSSFAKKKRDDQSEDGPLPPGPEAFITDEELVRSIQSRIDYHHPYDRSLLSLRDLFSLVLLRLTAPTQLVNTDDSEQSEEEKEQQLQVEDEALKINILERLSNYLISYCNRYANRLVDVIFVRNTAPAVIFQNHYTLGKILIEFSSKASQVFTYEDLFRCFWLIWAPLVQPRIIGRDGLPTLKVMVTEYGHESVQEAWYKMNIPNLAKVMVSEALGQPPSWKAGLWAPDKVENFVIASRWIREIKQVMGSDAFFNRAEDYTDLYGPSIIPNPHSSSPFGDTFLEHINSNFSRIEEYRPPLEEKYSLFFELEKAIPNSREDKDQLGRLAERISLQGLRQEYESYLAHPKPIRPVTEDEDGEIHCSRCGAELPELSQDALQRGRMVLCPNTKDAWLYLKPIIPDTLW